VIERDLDVFGLSVNLASRIAEGRRARRGCLATEAVAAAAGGSTFGFDRVQDATLKGLPEASSRSTG
jgi:class 3 adenylate cyclase